MVPRGCVGERQATRDRDPAVRQHRNARSHAEVVALRTILLNVLFRQANDETLTAEQMQTLIERADAEKLKKAMERLERASKSAGD